MPNDIFGQNSATYGGSFSADDAIMTFSQLRDASGANIGGSVPLLLQNMQMQYQQAITRLFNLSNSSIYLVRGRAQGNCNLTQVIGPAKISQAFLNTYGNVCNAATNNFDISIVDNSCGAGTGNLVGGGGIGYTAKYAVIEGMGIQVAAEQMVVQQNVQMSISALEYSG